MPPSFRVIKSDFRGLNNLVKAFGDGSKVRIGIMGDKAGTHYAKLEGKNASWVAGTAKRVLG